MEVIDAIRKLGRKMAPKYYRGLEDLTVAEYLDRYGELPLEQPSVFLLDSEECALQFTACPFPKWRFRWLPISPGNGQPPIDILVHILWPCGNRRCVHCENAWRSYHIAKIFSGVKGVPLHRLRLWTVTVPASVANAREWNETVFERLGKVWRAMKRRYPFLDSYYAVKEFQERGLLHVHVLIRQQNASLLPKEELEPGGWVTQCLERHNFGGHDWKKLKEELGGVPGVVGYLGKHLITTFEDERCPLKMRVDTCARNWGISWRQHRRRTR